METVLVITHCPDNNCAQAIAEFVIERKIAACVNIGSTVTSLYHWQGKIEQAQEIPLTFKTLKSHYAQLEKSIRQLHPYQEPEIIMIPIIDGAKSYLQWIADSVEHHVTTQ